MISQDIREFFNKGSNNSIVFWKYLSSTKWIHYLNVNKETKSSIMFLTSLANQRKRNMTSLIEIGK